MSLTPAQRRRFVRHLLLPEIGAAGQARLLEARFAPGEGGAHEVAAIYLTRAGLVEADDGAPMEVEPTDDPLDAALSGAMAAVEHVKRVLELGRPAPRSSVGPTRDPRS